MMKRWAMAAFLLLAVSAVQLEAGTLPKARLFTDRAASKSQAHSVRGSTKLPQPVPHTDRESHRGPQQGHLLRGK